MTLDKNELQQLKDSGLTLAQIANLKGVSRQRISQIFNNNHRYNPALDREIQRHYEHKNKPIGHKRKPCRYCSQSFKIKGKSLI